MTPGYSHNNINLSTTEDLVTLMWANEIFDQNHSDTFYEKFFEHYYMNTRHEHWWGIDIVLS